MYTEPGFGSIVFSEVFLSPAEQRKPRLCRPITAFFPKRYERESRPNPRPRPTSPYHPVNPGSSSFRQPFPVEGPPPRPSIRIGKQRRPIQIGRASCRERE